MPEKKPRLPKVQAAPGLSEAAMKALAKFGGLEGLIGLIREEYDHADRGSKLRYDYANMLVKLVTTNALSGGSEDVTSMTDEELEEAWDEELEKHQKAGGETPESVDELGTPPDE